MRIPGHHVVLVLLVVFCGAAPSAHHSAVQFDFGQSVPINGIVKRFEAINPHMRIVLEVADAKGTREIAFEGHSLNNMYRGGYRNGMIKYGDKIIVFVAPLKDGSEGGYVTAAVTASGVRFGQPSRADQERQRAEGR